MAQSDINVSKLAVALIGSRETLTALADTSAQGVACNQHLDETKKALLRMHPWNFATKRKKIQPFQNFAVSNVTFVSSELIEVTHAATTFSQGQYVTLTGIEGATGANGTWEVANVPGGTTVRLTAIGVTTSTILGTYTASSTDYIRRSPAYGYPYLYAMPTDCLRVLEINESAASPEWRIEGAFILATPDWLEIRYIYDVTDYATMDSLFYECLANLLAYKLCDHLTASDGKKNEIHAYLYGGQGKRGILPQARFVDACEDSLQQLEANDWIDSRSGNLTGRGA